MCRVFVYTVHQTVRRTDSHFDRETALANQQGQIILRASGNIMSVVTTQIVDNRHSGQRIEPFPGVLVAV